MRMKMYLAIVLAVAVVFGNVGSVLSVYAQEENVTAEQSETFDEKDIAEQTEDEEENPTGEEEIQEGGIEEGVAENETAVEDSSVGEEQAEETTDTEAEVPHVEYQAHVAKIGWQDSVKDGETAGTVGQSLAIEGLKIQLTGIDTEELAGSGVEYSAYVQDSGWQDSVKDGELAGTVGQSKKVEAVMIKLTGPIAEKYDIYYRVHCQSYGWLGWAKNGKKAGTSGFAKRVEAIEICLVRENGEAPGETKNCYVYQRIKYQAHCQSYGWMDSVGEDQIAGTVGENKRLEALKIELPETEYDGSIEYRVYLQGYGWQEPKSDGEIAGKVGEAKRIEAVEIWLKGEIEEYYDVYYSVHMAKIGWCNYASKGKTIGTTDLSKPIQAIKICLVKKDVDPIPDTSGDKYIAGYENGDFYYSAQIKDGNDTGNVAQGGTLGTTGQGKQLQNITLYLESDNEETPKGTIQYATHVSGSGWTDWVDNGNVSGSQDTSKGLEAVKIKLSGDIANYYDIYYRAHVQSYGWLGWAKNGQAAGTTKISYRLEALQIKLVSKDASAPGANSNYYKETKLITDKMLLKAMAYSSNTGYLILVDRSSHKVGIFQGSLNNWKSLKRWDCANGAPSTPTVAGQFTIGDRGYYFDSGASRCYWWTQFYGNYLFHSVLYNKDGTLRDGRVGMALSHGCVRLKIENAKWIYDNIPRGTKVVVY